MILNKLRVKWRWSQLLTNVMNQLICRSLKTKVEAISVTYKTRFRWLMSICNDKCEDSSCVDEMLVCTSHANFCSCSLMKLKTNVGLHPAQDEWSLHLCGHWQAFPNKSAFGVTAQWKIRKFRELLYTKLFWQVFLSLSEIPICVCDDFSASFCCCGYLINRLIRQQTVSHERML